MSAPQIAPGSCLAGFVGHGLVDAKDRYVGTYFCVYVGHDKVYVETHNARAFKRWKGGVPHHRKSRERTAPTLDEAFALIAREAGAACRRNRKRFAPAPDREPIEVWRENVARLRAELRANAELRAEGRQ